MAALSRFNESLPMLLLRARERTLAHFRPLLKSHGVTEQQWRVLRTLSDSDAMTASHLARECAILAPSLTRILRRLSADGLVRTRRSRGDQREVWVEIGARGTALVEALAPSIEAQYELIESRLTPTRLARLKKDLLRLIEIDD